MWDIISRINKEELEKCVGQNVYVRFEIDPKTLTCAGNVVKFLNRCAGLRELYKDGFYKLNKDESDDSYYLETEHGKMSTHFSFIKEIYGNIEFRK